MTTEKQNPREVRGAIRKLTAHLWRTERGRVKLVTFALIAALFALLAYEHGFVGALAMMGAMAVLAGVGLWGMQVFFDGATDKAQDDNPIDPG